MSKPRKVWNRDLVMEDRALKNAMYRTGALLGVLLTWTVVGTGLATFVEVAIVTVIFFVGFTVWDMRKVWKGK